MRAIAAVQVFTAFACVLLTACGGGGAGGSSAPPADTTAPTVSSVTPAAASAGNPSTTTVAASFSEPVNCARVNSGAIALTEGSTPIAGTTTCSGNTLTFTPA